MKKPDAIYRFSQSEKAHSRYLLREHRGIDIPDFPAVYVRGSNAGKKYIGFRATVQNKPNHRHYSHTIELANGKTVTGINFFHEHPRQSFGDYNDDGILIDLSDDGKTITMYFFRGMKEAAFHLFQKWTAGKLCLTAEADFLPLSK